MSDYSELIARAEQIQEGVTPGPWTWDGDTFSDAPEHKCPHGTQWTDHGPDLVRGNPDGSTFEEFDADDLVITSNGYDASGLEIKTADAEFIVNARDLVPELVSALKEAQANAATARQIIEELTDPDPCSFDHHGDCQAHGFFDLSSESPCGHAKAKRFLAEEGS